MSYPGSVGWTRALDYQLGLSDDEREPVTTKKVTVEFTDSTTETVMVDTSRADNEDEVAEIVARASSRPDDVDDFWESDDDDA